MSTIEIQTPDEARLTFEGQSLASRASALVVTSDPEYAKAGEFLVDVATLRKAIQSACGPAKKAAHEAHRQVCDLESRMLLPVTTAEASVKRIMSAYSAEQERIRREREAELQREAQKKAEDRAIAEAEAAQAAGQPEVAEAIISQPIVAPVVSVPRPKAAGVATRTGWGFEILDASAIQRPFLAPDEAKIRAQVNALGLDAARIVGGIRVFPTTTMAVRAR